MSLPALKTSWYYILLSLAGTDRHGLAVAREVLTLSDGRVKLWPAMLYGALEDLCECGWIEEISDSRREDESERKRYYRITRAGRATAAAETERLAALVRVARTRVKPRTGETT